MLLLFLLLMLCRKRPALLRAPPPPHHSTPSGIVAKPKKVKKKDDLGALLADGLAKAPKSKAEKEAEAKKKAKAEAKAKHEAEEAARTAKPVDPLAPAPLVPNANHAHFFDGGADAGADFEAAASGRKPKRVGGRGGAEAAEAPVDVVSASGMDGALAALAISTKGAGAAGGALSPRSGGTGLVANDPHPERRRKALYAAFEDKMLPLMREDFPGLKLSQYKDKIFKAWEKSPENPMNAL